MFVCVYIYIHACDLALLPFAAASHGCCSRQCCGKCLLHWKERLSQNCCGHANVHADGDVGVGGDVGDVGDMMCTLMAM